MYKFSDVKAWAADTGIRAVKTSAQTLVALFGASAFDVLHNVPWDVDLGIALGAGLVSILHNIASIPLGSDPTPATVEPVGSEPSAASTPQ